MPTAQAHAEDRASGVVSSSASASTGGALAVSLEGALVRTDLLLEAAFAEARRRPLAVPGLLAARTRGRTHLAARLAASGALDPAALPYDPAVVERARAAQASGRRVVLVARAERALAEAVAEHVGAFDAVYAPDGAAGESAATAHARFTREEPGAEPVAPTPRSTLSTLRAAARALRPHQWVKNTLVFVPAVLAHALRGDVLTRAGIAFLAFNFCASSVYVLNDLLDLHADRAHHRKRTRPFASGALPLGVGLLLAPTLLAAAGALLRFLPASFAAVLGGYYAATVAYSFVLKRMAMVDVLVLAGLYTARLMAGAEAYQVPISQWLLAFSLFFFLSLAFVKRFSEVQVLRKKGVEEVKGRGYRAGDLEQLSSLGGSAGYISVLVLALYIHSADVSRLYAHPGRLWAMLPLFLYWISRVWLLAQRGQMHDDPIVFAIRDRVSYAVAALLLAVVAFAI